MKCSTLSAFLIIITRKCKCSAVGETVLVPEACLSKKCTCDLVRYFVLPNCLFHLQILTKLWMSNDKNSFLIIHSLNCFCKFLPKRYLYLSSIMLFFTFLVDSQEDHNWTLKWKPLQPKMYIHIRRSYPCFVVENLVLLIFQTNLPNFRKIAVHCFT